MKLESQVCTLEQAKRLKELGVCQKSLFYHHAAFERPVLGETITTESGKQYKKTQVCNDKKAAFSAFTIAELGAIIPDYTPSLGNLEIGKCETDHVSMKLLKEGWWNVSYWTWSHKTHSKGGFYLEQKSDHLHQAPTLAQAMGAMLIYLIEKEIVKVDEVNQRLQNA